MQPVAAAREFESAGDDVRTRAAQLALSLPAVRADASLGESQRFHVERALALYHYINPKLLLFTVLVKRGLTDEGTRSGELGRAASAPQVPLGPPPEMAAMEMVDEKPSDKRVSRLVSDIKKTLQLSAIKQRLPHAGPVA